MRFGVDEMQEDVPKDQDELRKKLDEFRRKRFKEKLTKQRERDALAAKNFVVPVPKKEIIPEVTSVVMVPTPVAAVPKVQRPATTFVPTRKPPTQQTSAATTAAAKPGHLKPPAKPTALPKSLHHSKSAPALKETQKVVAAVNVAKPARAQVSNLYRKPAAAAAVTTEDKPAAPVSRQNMRYVSPRKSVLYLTYKYSQARVHHVSTETDAPIMMVAASQTEDIHADWNFRLEVGAFFEKANKKAKTALEKRVILRCIQSINQIVDGDLKLPANEKTSLTKDLAPAAEQSVKGSTPLLQRGAFQPSNRAQYTPQDEDEDSEYYESEGDEEALDDGDVEMSPTNAPVADASSTKEWSPFDIHRPSADDYEDDEEDVGMQMRDGGDEGDLDDEDFDGLSEGDEFDKENRLADEHLDLDDGDDDMLSNNDDDEEQRGEDDEDEDDDDVDIPPIKAFGRLKGTPHPKRRGEDVQGIVSMLDDMKIEGSSSSGAAVAVKEEKSTVMGPVAMRKNGVMEILCVPVSEDATTVTVLTPRRANRKERDELGVKSVVTNARRSMRLFRGDAQAIDVSGSTDTAAVIGAEARTKVSELLSGCGHAYIPNKVLQPSDSIQNRRPPVATHTSPVKETVAQHSATPMSSHRRKTVFQDLDLTPKARPSDRKL
ncbi:hypothetical protein HK101_001449 [Irineochytrium annulatum]|nr:hypothetical protein HK101_001449 [Irineochytrium annulatum]